MIRVGRNVGIRAPLSALGLAVGALLATGCPTPVNPSGRPRTEPRRRVVPKTVETHRLSLEAPATATEKARAVLPTFPRFRDPYPLPKRTLNRARRLGFKARGRARLLVHTHLAARLWGIANRNIDQIRRLEARARKNGRPAPGERIAKLRREASAHLQECVTLLDGVLEVKGAPIMARVRLAHYLRKLKPAAAIPHFRALIQGPGDPGARARFAVDLAQLLVSAGRPREAWDVLRRFGGRSRSARGQLIRAVARARAVRGRSPLGGDLRALAETADRLAPPVRRSWLGLLPELLAALRGPAPLLELLARRAPTTWRQRGARLAASGARRLLLEGRPSAAAALLRMAARRGAAVPAALAGRVARAGGPWPTRAMPPTPAEWTRLLRARLPSLHRCYVTTPAGTKALRLRILPGGTATASPHGPRAAPGRKARPVDPALRSCIRRELSAWRFPGWRAPRAVELAVQVTWRR